MHRRSALLAGLIAITLSGLVPALAALPVEPAKRSWAGSPRHPPFPHPVAPARWDRSSTESLALLRRVTVREARHAQLALADCERHAGRDVRRYRRCALTELDRTHAYASTNSRMLSKLVAGEIATTACRERVLALSGSTGMLAQIARATRLAGLDAAWIEVHAASRSIRGLARDALQQARGAEWARTCRPRPPAPALPDGTIT